MIEENMVPQYGIFSGFFSECVDNSLCFHPAFTQLGPNDHAISVCSLELDPFSKEFS